MGLDQWWSTGDGVSGKVIHQVVQQAAALRLINTDNVPIRTITSGTTLSSCCRQLANAIPTDPSRAAVGTQARREGSWLAATCRCSVP
jgi:hypothetical protein